MSQMHETETAEKLRAELQHMAFAMCDLRVSQQNLLKHLDALVNDAKDAIEIGPGGEGAALRRLALVRHAIAEALQRAR